MTAAVKWGILSFSITLWARPAWPASNVYLMDVPDYAWYFGCMGTAAGNLMGYWDRHGFPDFYTGPVNGGLAPLNTVGANAAIVSMWASQAGIDGRPADQPGHVDDYYVAYESTAADPYLTAGRAEHTPDCIGDFIGLNQLNWTNMAGECNGNIDGFCFVYWDTNGDRRVNFTPSADAGEPAVDVQSGLRAWTQYRGYDCEIFTQLTDFNPTVLPGRGFTFNDLKAEIDAGYPVLLFLQDSNQMSRTVNLVPNVNPEIHSMLAYGYYVTTANYVRYRTSWASGVRVSLWGSQAWQVSLPVRGVIVYHPLPKIRLCSVSDGNVSLQWDGPAADLYDLGLGATNRVHGYVVEMSSSLVSPNFTAISPMLLTNTFTVTNCPSPAYLRVELVKP